MIPKVHLLLEWDWKRLEKNVTMYDRGELSNMNSLG